MWQHSRTLRFRLTLMYFVVFALILSVLGFFVLTVRKDYLREDFDERLVDRAEAMVEAIEIEAERLAQRPTPGRTKPHLNPFRSPGYYFQLRLEEGTIFERSYNLKETTLPWTPTTQRAKVTDGPSLEVISGDLAKSILGHPGKLRLLTLYHDSAEAEPYFLQVGVSLDRVNESVASLRRLLLLVIPAGLALASLASWFLAKRSLTPIGRIARVARELTAEHLDRRIDVPPGRDEVAEMVTTINQMLDRLEASFHAQERFTADAAHELQTPVAVLLGQAQVLSQQARSEEEHDRFVASVQDEMRQLAKTVDGLLTLARSDAGMPPGALTKVSLNEAVTDAVQRCEPLARQQEVRLVPMLAMPRPDYPEPLVTGDGELLRTMIANVVRNAIRYSPIDKPVEIKILAENNQAIVSVRDYGPGIPSEYLDRVFDRFFHVPRDDGSARSTGLGLAIAKGVADLHRGGISVSNDADGGCAFVIHLPLAPTP